MLRYQKYKLNTNQSVESGCDLNNNKIIFVAPSNLPIPAINGGGYELLMEDIINQNEIQKRFQISVISFYNKSALPLRNNYKHTKFFDIRANLLIRLINFFKRKFHFYLFKKKYPNFVNDQIINYVKLIKPSKIVIFGNADHIEIIEKVVPEANIYFYLATEILKRVDEFSKCYKVIVGNNRLVDLVLSNNNRLLKNKVINLRPGLNFAKYIKPKEEIITYLREKYAFGEKDIIVSYIGRVVKSKGVEILLKASNLILGKAKFKVLIVGSLGSNFGANIKRKETKEEIELKELICSLGNNCICTGFLPNSQFAEILSLVDIGVVPSLVEDVAPGTYLQYQIAGKPTIVSDAGGIPEFFSSDYSIMVNRGPQMVEQLANDLLKLIEDKNLRIQMGEAALRNRDYLSIERYYNDFSKTILS